MEKLIVSIQGMRCGNCKNKVTSALSPLDGVQAVLINHVKGEGLIHLAPDSPTTFRIIQELLGDLGFPTTFVSSSLLDDASALDTAQLYLRVEGLSSSHQLDSFFHPQQVSQVSCLPLEDGSWEVNLQYMSAHIGARSLIQKLGTQVSHVELLSGKPLAARQTEKSLENQERRLYRNFGLALPVGLITLLVTHFLGPTYKQGLAQEYCGLDLEFLMVLVLSFHVQFYCARDIHRGALASLKGGHANMDVLVSLSTNIAWLYSLCVAGVLLWASLNGLPLPTNDGLHFLSMTPILISAVLGGRLLESRAKRKANDLIKELNRLARSNRYQQVCLWQEQKGVEKDSRLVERGDVLLVNPGEEIPFDAKVCWVQEEQATVHEALLTGESHPVSKQVGDLVYGGCTLLTSKIRVKVTHVGSHSLLSTLVTLVQEAQFTRGDLQLLADRIASYFVGAVLSLSLLVLVGWLYVAEDWMEGGFHKALNHAVSVMMIACPCALGLATPIVHTVASSLALRMGCLIKDARIWERLPGCQLIVLDKSGTITSDKPNVANAWLGPEVDWPCLLALELEAPQHPLAAALLGYLQANHPISEDPQILQCVHHRVGAGISAVFQGTPLLLGSLKWVEAEGHTLSPEHLNWIEHEQSLARSTCVYIQGSKVMALFSFGNEVLPGNKEAIRRLRQKYRVIMLTGDNRKCAQALAAEVGISEVFAECSPEDKLKTVAKLAEDHKVLMVGDGVNDAPAMAKAYASMSVGISHSLVSRAADICSTQHSLSNLVSLLDLSQKSLRTMYFNFVWAFIFNFFSLPIAAGLLSPWNISISPLTAGLAMALSSVLVTWQSLMLLYSFTPMEV